MTEPQVPPPGADEGAASDGGVSGPAANQPGATPQKLRKKRRRWPWITAALVIVLALLVAFAPTIASMGWVRALVVQQINKSLDGNLEINDWSLSWASGIEARGVRVFQDRAQIMELRRLRTDLSMLNLIRGDLYTLGKTKVEGLDLLLKVYPNGRTNLHRLLKLQPSDKPLEMPPVSGQLEADFRATIEQAGKTPLMIDPSSLKLDIADINGPIANQLELALRLGSSPSGKVRTSGSLKLFQKGRLDPAALTADETIEVQSVDLNSLAAFLPAGGPISQIQGVANGKFLAKTAGGNEVTFEGQATADGLTIAGPALRGDTYRSARLTMTVPPTTFNRATGNIRTGNSAQNNQIVFQVDQGTAALTVDATQAALSNLAGNRAPGAPGRIALTADFDVAKLAEQLPHLLQLKQGIKPTSGRIHQETEIVLQPDKASLKQQVDLTDLAAVDANNQRIAAQPVHLAYSATSLGGGGVVPDLRDLVMTLQSSFATITGKGESLAKLTIEGKANLADLQRELGQFVNLGSVQMAGHATFNLTTSGQLAQEDNSATVDATVTATNLRITGPTTQPIDEPWMQATAKASLVRGKQAFIKAIRDAVVTVQTGSAQKPTVDIRALADVPFRSGATAPATMPTFEIARCNVDLPAAQKEFGSLLKVLQDRGWTFSSGSLALQGAGSYDGVAANVRSLKVDLADLSLDRIEASGQTTSVLKRYSATVDAAGTLRRGQQSLDLLIAKLTWSEAAKSLDQKTSLMNVSVSDTSLRLSQGAAPVSLLDMVQKAQVTLDVQDVPRAMALLQAVAPTQSPPTTMPSQPRGRALRTPRVDNAPPADAPAAEELPPIAIRSGSVKGTIRIERSAKGLALNVDNLSGDRFVIERGRGTFASRPIALKLAALIVPDTQDPAKPLLQQIKEIQLSDLSGSAGVADISMPEPIVIRGLGSAVQASGSVKLSGQIRQVCDLLEALQSQPPGTQYDYSGAFTITQRIRTDGPTVLSAGEITIDNFAAGNPRRPKFLEKAVRIANEVALDQKAKALTIKNVSLDMADNKALGLALSGAVGDYSGQRTLDNVRLRLSYDAAKLLEIVKPMLSPEQLQSLGDLKLAGVVRDREIIIAGKYPAAAPEAPRRGKPVDPLQYLRAQGVLTFDRIEYQGMVGEFREVPFSLADGVLRLLYADRPQGQQLPPPAPLNGGKCDFGGLEVTIAGGVLRVNSPRKDYKLLDNVAINRQFVEQYLGKLNPVFTVPKDAKGLISVTVNELSQLPLGQALTNPAKRETGRGSFTFSITDLRLRSIFMELLATQLQLKLAKDGTLPTTIRNATVQIEPGTVKSDMGLEIGGQVIGCRETEVRLSDQTIVSMTMTVPKAMIPLAQVRNGKLFKDLFSVPVTGTLGKFQFEIIETAEKSVNPLGVIDQLLKGKESDAPRKERAK